MYAIDLPCQLILLPGVGMNHKIYTPQKRVFGDDLIAPDWIKPHPHESIGGLAARWAEELKKQINPDVPVLVGGTSMGGMIALEMAPHLDALAVILIASARRASDVPATTRIADWFGRLLPKALMPKAMLAALLPISLVEDLDDDNFALMKELAAEVDTDVLRWSHGAIADWEYEAAPGTASIPVCQIHGEKDRVLPCPPDADVVIPGGHHLINLTHDKVVNQFIVDCVEKHVGRSAVPVL